MTINYDPIIFDLDGTLLNTLGDLAAAGNFALEQCGFPVHEEEKYRYFVGNGIPKLIERICPPNSSAEVLERVHTLFAEYYGQHSADRTKPYDGLTELLAELKALGVTAVCNTNKDYAFAETLLRSFYGDSLAETVGAGLGYPTKPDPSAALYLARKYAVNDRKPLYVGDSGVDMQTALNAGIAACGALWGFRGIAELERFNPAHTAENAAQLRGIILGSSQ
ncbi:MAG: HAD hydrolase-like protein [Lachnospiraceae bacterium]|nr:HAD hydrolase-like protein [Ruminococcus sp.]MCM1274878.1 HAD hydrolase-like protein [Lachnospiraceae bacterium]